ncbi:MAG: hypothetical protein KAV87_46740 [Desulfobacteraceae bacterium]|nr:hypothetical protein [Desulfobacteraceae bacterium]
MKTPLFGIIAMILMCGRIKRWMVLAAGCVLLCTAAQAGLVAHYDFSDGNLLDNAVKGGSALVQQGPAKATVVSR